MNSDPLGIISEFLSRALKDADEGALRTVEEYQAQFPGHEETIAKEYAKLTGEESPTENQVLNSLNIDLSAVEMPEAIGPYKILRKLGEGGMGAVYLAQQEEPIRRRVALKIIKLGMDSKEVLTRFEAERQALSLMNHPGIAQVLDAGTTETGRPYFVMEHVAGISLTEYCDRHFSSTEERLNIFVEICEAIQHAHQKGVIHRDLKPSNILITSSENKPHPKIIDFGIAKSIDHRLTQKTVFTELGQIIGTPEYMSPEQADLTSLDIDTRSDIYSLGVILYELLVGALPFDGKELRSRGYEEIRRRLREDTPAKPSTRLSGLGQSATQIAVRRSTDLSSLRKRLKGDLDWIIMCALEKDRTRRYSNALDLASDVKRHLAHEPVEAGPPSWFYKAQKFVRRRRRGLVACLIVMLLTGASVYGAKIFFEDQHRDQLLQQSRQMFADGTQLLDRYDSLTQELLTEERKLASLLDQPNKHLPVWELTEDIEAIQKVRNLRESREKSLNDARLLFEQARAIAPEKTIEKFKVSEKFESLWNSKTDTEVALPRDFYRGDVTPDFNKNPIKITITTQPAESDVYCFKYTELGACSTPVPLGSSIKDLPLFIEKVWVTPPEEIPDNYRSAAGYDRRIPFQAQDQLLKVVDNELKDRNDLATVLNATQEDQVLSIAVNRANQETTLEWVPFPATDLSSLSQENSPDPREDDFFEASKAYDFYEQFGFTLQAFPLEIPEGNSECHLGTTSTSGELEIDLKPGNYLLLVKKEGFVDLRYPLNSFSQLENLSLSLQTTESMPDGFTYIPQGNFQAGGDWKVDQSLPSQVQQVADYFIQTHEVTFGQYLEFLNDPQTLSNIDAEGFLIQIRATWPEVLDRSYGEREKKLRIIPSYSGTDYFAKGEDSQYSVTAINLDKPIDGLSVGMALEYAHWMTQTQGQGRWVFRLPTDLEWEKAARGADARPYVWGHIPVSSYFWSLKGRVWKTIRRRPVGSFPYDESVYGVRDLTGSVREPTSGVVDRWYSVYRGTSYYRSTGYFSRIANRNGWIPRNTVRDGGVRLVAKKVGEGES